MGLCYYFTQMISKFWRRLDLNEVGYGELITTHK